MQKPPVKNQEKKPGVKIDDVIAYYRKNRITVESDEGGRHPVRENSRDMMCLTSDGTLFVLAGELNNQEVMAYRALLRRRGVTLRGTREVSVSLLRRFYAELGNKNDEGIRVVDSIGSTSQRQIEVIRMITDAVRRKASDIHITVFKDRGTIAYRIHGNLYRIQEPPKEKCEEMCATIYQTMCDIADPTYKPHDHQDARMHAEFVTRCGLFGARIASAPTDSGSRMVIRLLYDSAKNIPSLKRLGYLPEQIDQIDVMRRHTSGINILSGATGSGKSTTLVSVLDSIIQRAKLGGKPLDDNGAEEFLGISVITIEDPPEYKINGATQTPLKADKSDEESVRRGWAKGISAAMRQDPDVMMIGEIRDQGSARAAFDAATTGHGVWTTVHTTDAVQIMIRLESLGVERDRMLDPEVVTGLINQSLTQHLCPDCSIPWEQGKHLVLDPAQRKRIEAYCDTAEVRLRGDGCSTCGGEGIVGRIVIAEVILPNFEFMEVFAEQGKAKARHHWVRNMGGITKCMALIRRINEGFVDPREGEAKVSALDKDATTMGIDYSKTGDFTQAHEVLRAQTTSKQWLAELAQEAAERESAEEFSPPELQDIPARPSRAQEQGTVTPSPLPRKPKADQTVNPRTSLHTEGSAKEPGAPEKLLRPAPTPRPIPAPHMKQVRRA